MKRNSFLKAIIGLPFVASLIKTNVSKNKEVVFTMEMLKKHNFGLFIINTKAKNVAINPDYAATVSWKLCWSLGDSTYAKVNFLTDGWICPIGKTKEEVCNYLNNNPHGEKFRIMTEEEVIYILQNKRNKKQLFYDKNISSNNLL